MSKGLMLAGEGWSTAIGVVVYQAQLADLMLTLLHNVTSQVTLLNVVEQDFYNTCARPELRSLFIAHCLIYQLAEIHVINYSK